jgi:hypothetical protein
MACWYDIMLRWTSTSILGGQFHKCHMPFFARTTEEFM